MYVEATVKFHYENGPEAEIALNSLQPDDMELSSAHVEDSRLIYEIKGNSLKTFLSTIDDLLFCEMMVEKVLELDK